MVSLITHSWMMELEALRRHTALAIIIFYNFWNSHYLILLDMTLTRQVLLAQPHW